MKKKYALALSGGGFKGAYQLGAIRYLRENWEQITGEKEFHFDLVCGVSAGALNGILTASRQLDELETLWGKVQENGGQEIYNSAYISNHGKIELSLRQLEKDLLPGFKVDAGMVAKGAWNSIRRIFDKKVPGLLATLLQLAEKEFNQNFPNFKSLADNKPLEKKLTEYVRRGNIPEDTVYRCGFVSLNDGLYYSFSQRDFNNDKDFIQAILASTSMPIIWPPVPDIHLYRKKRDLKNAVDGGLRNISPLADVVKSIDKDPEDIPYEVIIINCNSNYISPINETWNIGDIALRSLTEITLGEIFNDDVRAFIRTNEFVKQAAAGNVKLKWKGRVRKYFDYKIIEPVKNELGDTLDSHPEIIEKRIQLGYEQARLAFQGGDNTASISDAKVNL